MSVLGWLIVVMYALASVGHVVMWMRERAYRNYMLAPKHKRKLNKVEIA